MIAFHVSALHQRIDLWEEDASEFRPERWLTEKPSWVNTPLLLHISLALTCAEILALQRRSPSVYWP